MGTELVAGMIYDAPENLKAEGICDACWRLHYEPCVFFTEPKSYCRCSCTPFEDWCGCVPQALSGRHLAEREGGLLHAKPPSILVCSKEDWTGFVFRAQERERVAFTPGPPQPFPAHHILAFQH